MDQVQIDQDQFEEQVIKTLFYLEQNQQKKEEYALKLKEILKRKILKKVDNNEEITDLEFSIIFQERLEDLKFQEMIKENYLNRKTQEQIQKEQEIYLLEYLSSAGKELFLLSEQLALIGSQNILLIRLLSEKLAPEKEVINLASKEGLEFAGKIKNLLLRYLQEQDLTSQTKQLFDLLKDAFQIDSSIFWDVCKDSFQQGIQQFKEVAQLPLKQMVSAQIFKNVLKSQFVVNVLISSTIVLYKIGKSGLNLFQRNITQEKFQKDVEIALVEGAGNLIGGTGGWIAGATIGSSFGPIGLFVGGIVGGMIGGIVCQKVGFKIFNYATGEENKMREQILENSRKRLGVRPDDNWERIVKNYRDQVLLYHPDKNQHLPQNEKQIRAQTFQEIHQAFCILKDYEKNVKKNLKIDKIFEKLSNFILLNDYFTKNDQQILLLNNEQ